MAPSAKVLTAGSIVGIVFGSLFGALYIYCCFLSVRKAIRDRRAKIARNIARRKAKAFREHHSELAKKFNELSGNGASPDNPPYLLSGSDRHRGSKVSIISVDGIPQPNRPSIFLSGRRRSSSTITPPEVKPKITVLPNRKFAINKETASVMAANNAARPPPGVMSGGCNYQLPPYVHPQVLGRDPMLPGTTQRIPLAMREESLDDCSSMSSMSSFVSGSHYSLYAGPSFRRRNSYEHAMRKTNLPPVVHPLRDKRAQAAAALKAANAAARAIDRIAEAEENKRKEREKQRQIKEDSEGERKALELDRLSREDREMKEKSAAEGSADASTGGEDKADGSSISSMTEPLTVQCPVWIHPDVPVEGYRNSGYHEADYHGYL